jgi:hypothetical protein
VSTLALLVLLLLVLVGALVVGALAYLAYRHPRTRSPITIALATITVLSGLVAMAVQAGSQPDGQVAAKPYKLLRQALERSSRVAIAKYAWSGREHLGLLRVRDDVIVLHAMRWPDEIRDPSSLIPPSVEVSDEEIDRALALMDTMTRDDLDSPEFRDT